MRLILKSTLGITLSLGVVFFSSCKKKQESSKKEIDSVYATSSSTELCEKSWFPHSQTKNPAEGKGSPFDTDSSTNRMFHQWSWQKFLWLTKPTLVEEAEIPLFLNHEKIFQVDSHMKPVKDVEGVNVILTDTLQAGPGGVLKTNPKFNSDNKSETVFYSIHIDPILKKSAEKFKNAIISGELDENNYKTFPVGALELKVSWVATSAIPKEELSNYYVTTAAISRDTINYSKTEVAMLGMHVVGVVENHPEFIWATFEHDDLAPNYNWKQNKATSKDQKLLFEKGETSGLDAITWDTLKHQPNVKDKAYDLFQYGVPRNPDGSYMKTSQGGKKNFDNVNNLNECVKKNLKDVWRNYFYNGSIWINTDGMSPEEQAKKIVELGQGIDNGKEGSLARGSLNCANVTMETYTQTFQNDLSKIKANTLVNCFTCHNAVNFDVEDKDNRPSSPLYLSHIFNGYVERERGKSAKEVEVLKAKHELEEYMKNTLEN
ncbi:hypothetical protein [Tenacibaculum xiamenense]|uniref:hypothetical protein n=1 Tax=Tenacibaculum xiamenense TaxID=1261553 RepID=UPI0038933B5C